MGDGLWGKGCGGRAVAVTLAVENSIMRMSSPCDEEKGGRGGWAGEAVRRLQESTDRTRGGFASRLLALVVKLSGRLANRAGGLVPLVE